MTTRTDNERENGVADAEPDYRFTLANERTFLAWIRTSLGTLAAGVAIHEMLPVTGNFVAPNAISLAFIVLSVLLATGAYFHWRTAQQAIRRGGPLRGTTMVTTVTAALALVALLACVVIVAS